MQWHNPPHTWIKDFSKQIFLKQVAKEENREESEAGWSPALWAGPSAEAPFDLTSPRTKAEEEEAEPASHQPECELLSEFSQHHWEISPLG